MDRVAGMESLACKEAIGYSLVPVKDSARCKT
jgi:hypothetical protein